MANSKIIDLLQRDLDHELTEAEQEYLDEHLARSPEDAALASRFQQLTFELSNLPRVTPVLPLTEIVLEQMEEREREHMRKQRLKRWKMISMFLIFLLICLSVVIVFVPLKTLHG
jgi:hypothetical protein